MILLQVKRDSKRTLDASDGAVMVGGSPIFLTQRARAVFPLINILQALLLTASFPVPNTEPGSEINIP